MGYTHYWRNPSGFPAATWKRITKDVRLVLAKLPKDCKIDDQNGGVPIINDEMIWFNGVGDGEYETFHLAAGAQTFEFCKTAMKPYDLAVTAVLLIAKHHHKAFDVSSDGKPEEWAPAKKLVKKVLGYKTKAPGE